MSPFTKNSEMTSLILDSLPMGVLFCDMDYIIRFVNKAYADLLGRRPEELLGCDITEIIPHSRARVVLRDGRAEMGELCQLGPGNALPVVVNRIPVRDGQGRLAGMVSQAIFNDPEELKKLSSKIDHLGHTLNQYKRRIKASLAPQYSLRSILGESAPMRHGDMIQVDDFPPDTLPSADLPLRAVAAGDLSDIMADTEAVVIRKVLAEQGGNVSRTARTLHIARATLYEKLRKYGISRRST